MSATTLPCKNAVREVLAKAGAIDVLFNNAGVGYMATVEDLRMEDWRRQFETNFFGVLRVTQAVLPHMRERRRGRILMMSSVSGLVTPPTQGAYSAASTRLEGLSNALRLEMYAFGIDVVLIEPGYIVTGIQQAVTRTHETLRRQDRKRPVRLAVRQILGQRPGRPRKIEDHAGRLCARDPPAIEAPRPKPRYGVTPPRRS